MLVNRGAKSPPIDDGPAKSQPAPHDSQFAGGELALYPDRAELCGVTLITSMGAGQSLMLLRELGRKDRQGRFVRRSGEELATAIRALGGAGTVSGCVRAIRRNATARLYKHLGVICGGDDVICSGDQGYHLRQWISVREERNGEATSGHLRRERGHA
ncbi:MAG: hypothetical protein ACOY3P_23035 [Planctomycetota bacterium]